MAAGLLPGIEIGHALDVFTLAADLRRGLDLRRVLPARRSGHRLRSGIEVSRAGPSETRIQISHSASR